MKKEYVIGAVAALALLWAVKNVAVLAPVKALTDKAGL